VNLRPIGEPGDELITPERAADHLRIDYLDEVRDQLELYILAAREYAEQKTGRALVERTWELTLDRFPRGPIEVRKVPINPESIEVHYIDPQGDERTIDAGDLVTVPGEPARIVHVLSWPATAHRIGAVRVRFEAGPSAAEQGSRELSILTSAMLLHIGDMFEHREETVVGASVNPRRAIEDIYDAFLVGRRYA